MALIHHDQRDYKQAVDETALAFQNQLFGLIEKGRTTAGNVISKIEKEIPTDIIVPVSSMSAFNVSDGNIRFIDGTIHQHALNQFCEKVGIPKVYADRLLAKGDWGKELLVANLNDQYTNYEESESKFLIRSVDSQVRGFLSDKFRRLDSRPIIDAFVKACAEVGAVPIEGVGGDTRICIKAVLPMVFRVGDEILAYGVTISNSDFGNGALSVRIFLLRVWCTNFAQMDEALREIHLGRKLDANIEYSAKTYELDSQAMASAVTDIISSKLSPEAVESYLDSIRRSVEEKVDPKNLMTRLTNMGFLKREAEQVREIYNDGGVEQLPPGNNSWRFSNAISWLAHQPGIAPERQLELEVQAGKVLAAVAAPN